MSWFRRNTAEAVASDAEKAYTRRMNTAATKLKALWRKTKDVTKRGLVRLRRIVKRAAKITAGLGLLTGSALGLGAMVVAETAVDLTARAVVGALDVGYQAATWSVYGVRSFWDFMIRSEYDLPIMATSIGVSLACYVLTRNVSLSARARRWVENFSISVDLFSVTKGYLSLASQTRWALFHTSVGSWAQYRAKKAPRRENPVMALRVMHAQHLVRKLYRYDSISARASKLVHLRLVPDLEETIETVQLNMVEQAIVETNGLPPKARQARLQQLTDEAPEIEDRSYLFGVWAAADAKLDPLMKTMAKNKVWGALSAAITGGGLNFHHARNGFNAEWSRLESQAA